MSNISKIIFTTVLSIGLAYSSICAQTVKTNLTPNEVEFSNLITAADASLDSGDFDRANQNLLRANEILTNDPTINDALQGHFYKEKAKLSIDDLPTALRFFGEARSKFEGNAIEQAETDMFTGIAYYFDGNSELAGLYYESSKLVFASRRDNLKLAQVYNNIGVLNYKKGNIQDAIYFCNLANELNDRIGNKINSARNQQNLAVFSGTVNGFGTGPKIGKNTKVIADGGSGDSGSVITTSGGGTVVVGGGTGGGLK